MRALTTREKALTTLVALALIFTLTQSLVIAPQRRRLLQAQTELNTANQRFASLATQLTGFKSLRQEVYNKEQQLAQLTQSLSLAGELTSVIHRLTRLAQIHGLRLQYLRPQETQLLSAGTGKPESYRRAVMELGIRCRYKVLGKFLAALEKEQAFVRITDLRVEGDQAEAPFLDVKLTVAILARS